MVGKNGESTPRKVGNRWLHDPRMLQARDGPVRLQLMKQRVQWLSPGTSGFGNLFPMDHFLIIPALAWIFRFGGKASHLSAIQATTSRISLSPTNIAPLGGHLKDQFAEGALCEVPCELEGGYLTFGGTRTLGGGGQEPTSCKMGRLGSTK